MIKQFLELGQIVGTHGIHGEVKVNPWCDDAEFAKRFKKVYLKNGDYEAVKVLSCRHHKNQILMLLEGFGSIEAAESLRNRLLYIARGDAKLEDGVWFIEELIGCSVLDADDNTRCYGELTDVSKTGANDVWEITSPDGKQYLIPAIKDVVINADVMNNTVYIRPLKGIFNDAD